jgi:acrylyl-CoA reductase (NADPH)
VAPFILRGITLVGIDSVMAPLFARHEAWQKLSTDLDRDKLAAISREISLNEVESMARQIMSGSLRGRVVVRL